jgi:uncharacterized protein (TIGR03435 family)
MKWTKAKTMVAAGGAIAMVAAAAMIVKLHYFPAVRDAYFKPDFDNLRKVPAGIVAVRPTHATRSIGDPIRNIEDGDSLVRAVGYGVTLRNLIAEAYDYKPGRVVLPANAPKTRFDFLVTTTTEPREHLQSAIRKDLGYLVRRETRETDVLKLQVDDPNLPGLTVSPEGEDETIQYKDGRLYFRHKNLKLLLAGLEDGLALPVLDGTGLTGRYNFSIVWNETIQEHMQNGAFDLDGVRKVLKELGLRLEPGTASLDMVVVEKAR